MPSLYGSLCVSTEWAALLDPAVYEKVKRRYDYIYCNVEFEGIQYYYIADEDNISVGDYVIVPGGKTNHHLCCESKGGIFRRGGCASTA